MMTLDDCHVMLTNLHAHLPAHTCKMVQVYCKDKPLEFQLGEIARELAYLRGYQDALKETLQESHDRVIEAIDTAIIAMRMYRENLSRSRLERGYVQR